MSIKLSKQAEEVVYKRKCRVEGVECDVCKTLIQPMKYRSEQNKYFCVTTGHNDWGNDSCESIEHLDICPCCINGFISDYISNIGGSEYLDFETKYAWTNDYKYED